MDIPLITSSGGRTDQVSPAVAEAVHRALDETGCCVIERAAPAATMDAIAAELAPFGNGASVGASAFEGFATRRTGAPLPRSPTFRSIAIHPLVMTAGNHVLGHATSWRFSAAEYIEIGAGETAQRLHRDQWKYDMVDFEFEVELNGMWAVTDFTEENGATRVVPGSHRLGNNEKLRHEDTVPAEMAKGSLLLYTGSLYHGGGENRSAERRAGLSLQHAVGWLTQSTNQFLECPPAEVGHWPDELLRFIGYAKTGNGLGYWRDSEDPLSAVHPHRRFERGWATVRSDRGGR
ncbi:MAG: phytanoyl-CoA dioxygenase family protein [Acidimicrobiales bacterium]